MLRMREKIKILKKKYSDVKINDIEIVIRCKNMKRYRESFNTELYKYNPKYCLLLESLHWIEFTD